MSAIRLCGMSRLRAAAVRVQRDPRATDDVIGGANPRLGAASWSWTVHTATTLPATENSAQAISAQRKAGSGGRLGRADADRGDDRRGDSYPDRRPTCLVALYSAVAAPVCSGATVSKADAWVGMKVCAWPNAEDQHQRQPARPGGCQLLITNARREQRRGDGELPGRDQPAGPDPAVVAGRRPGCPP